MKEWFEYYKIPIIFAAIGLIIAILFITIGFFKTMLLLIFIALGGFLGLYLKKIKEDRFHKLLIQLQSS